MWGRETELRRMQEATHGAGAHLFTITGRRRIGKSTLAKGFAKSFANHFFEFSGLAPAAGQTNQHQLDHFLNLLKAQASTRRDRLTTWDDAFFELFAQISRKNKVVVLLDEISWMGSDDASFPSVLKSAWDTHFSKHKNLTLILCGSVSTWVNENILNSTNFVGRVSLSINLNELPLRVISKFWGKWDARVTNLEKLRLLSVIGCIPRYLEEVNPQISLDQWIKRSCFDQSGFLYNEYQSIFSEILGRKAATYRRICEHLSASSMTATKLAKKMNVKIAGTFTDYLHDLEQSGFLSRDHSFKLGSMSSKTSRYRFKDNYLRFALKYIEPLKPRLKNIEKSFQGLSMLPHWESILGLQFENLVLNHLDEILVKIQIPPETLISASPYFQQKTTKNKGACQIDLLIQTKHGTAYVCEIKLRESIERSVIKEVEKKISLIEKRRNWSYRPILIYGGKLNRNDEGLLNEFFSKLINVGDLLRE